jgi:hypothetical protein
MKIIKPLKSSIITAHIIGYCSFLSLFLTLFPYSGIKINNGNIFDLFRSSFWFVIFINKTKMEKQKNSNLSFTINIKDYNNNEDIINYLIKAITTSLELNDDNKFLSDMKDANEINLSLKKNLKIKIKDCGCGQ